MKYLLIPLSILGALILDSMPLPAQISTFRPEFTTLIVVYWVMFNPRQVSIGSAWFVGILQDTLNGGWLGLHAFTKSIIAYFVQRLHLQIQIFPAWQQMAMVLLFSYLDHSLASLIYSAFQPSSLHLADLVRPLSTALFWPFIYLGISKLRYWARLA